MGISFRALNADEIGSYDELFKNASLPLTQQSSSWAEIVAPLGPDQPRFLVAEDAGKVVGGLPIYLFESPLGSILTSVPQAGPLGGVLTRKECSPSTRAEVYAGLLREALREGERLGCAALSIITHPLLKDEELYSKAVAPSYSFKNFTQIVSIPKFMSGGGESFNAGSSKNNTRIRRNLAKASEAGLTAEWAAGGDFESWYKLHEKRHGELGAKPLSKALLQGILDKLVRKEAGGLVVAKKGGEVTGGCIFIWSKDVADAFIMSSDSDYLPMGINYLLTEFAIRDFSRRKIEWFNWQSCQRGSGVYIFKEQWGSVEFPYYFLTWALPRFPALFAHPVSEITAAFPWHYVAPFEALEKRVLSGSFDKKP